MREFFNSGNFEFHLCQIIHYIFEYFSVEFFICDWSINARWTLLHLSSLKWLVYSVLSVIRSWKICPYSLYNILLGSPGWLVWRLVNPGGSRKVVVGLCPLFCPWQMFAFLPNCSKGPRGVLQPPSRHHHRQGRHHRRTAWLLPHSAVRPPGHRQPCELQRGLSPQLWGVHGQAPANQLQTLPRLLQLARSCQGPRPGPVCPQVGLPGWTVYPQAAASQLGEAPLLFVGGKVVKAFLFVSWGRETNFFGRASDT